MGAWDSGTAEAVLGAQGGDPMREGYLADTIGRYLQDPASVGLEQFRKNTIDNFNKYAESVRDPRGGDFVRIEPQPVNFGEQAVRSRLDEQVDAIRKDKTPDEIRRSAAAGWSTRLPGDRMQRAEEAAQRASDATGTISRKQEALIGDLALKGYVSP